MPEASEPSYLDTSLRELSQIDPSSPDFDRAFKEQLGPYVRQVGRDIAALHLAGNSMTDPIEALGDVTGPASVGRYPERVRAVMWTLHEFSRGYESHVRYDEIIKARQPRIADENFTDFIGDMPPELASALQDGSTPAA